MHLRVSFQSQYRCKISDLDGIFWGQRFNYLSRDQGKDCRALIDLGEWFGLDSGPFVTLAFYAETLGDLRSLFIVREIDNVEDRNLVNRFVPFDTLARYASWFPMAARGSGEVQASLG